MSIILALLLILISSPALGWGGLWDASVFYCDGSIKVGWDATDNSCASGDCGYELELRNLENPLYIERYKVPGYATVEFSTPYKKSGHYEAWVRCYDGAEVSDWSHSLDPTTTVIDPPFVTTRVNKAWIIFRRLPAPSGGGIE